MQNINTETRYGSSKVFNIFSPLLNTECGERFLWKYDHFNQASSVVRATRSQPIKCAAKSGLVYINVGQVTHGDVFSTYVLNTWFYTFWLI